VRSTEPRKARALAFLEKHPNVRRACFAPRAHHPDVGGPSRARALTHHHDLANSPTNSTKSMKSSPLIHDR
jgi:hypothetical protein